MATEVESTGSEVTFIHYILNKIDWDVPSKYVDLIPIGLSEYGPVCSALNNEHNVQMAIKKLARPFQSVTHAKRTYRELRLLKHMHHKNVIGLLDVFTPATTLANFNDVYLVTHLMGADLNQIIKSKQLTDEHVQFLIYQVLCGLKYIHSSGIIHGDLKPSNIAVNEDSQLKILDFGLTQLTDDQMPGYVATRWYRAPEIMFDWMPYNQTVDIWSVGCIMAELLTGHPLFPRSDQIEHLKSIVDICGTPRDDLIDRISSQSARNFIKTLPIIPKKDFSNVFSGANPKAVDLLEKILVYDTDRRLTAEQALAHPYFETVYDPEDQANAPLYDKSYDDAELTIEEWKQLAYKEIINFTFSPDILDD